MNLPTIEPFEICSIRPPTENFSLTFRMTRNCYWNRCGFCPVYKFGARFSRRSFQEVTHDIENAAKIDQLLGNQGIYEDDLLEQCYHKLYQLETCIEKASTQSGSLFSDADSGKNLHLDPSLAWFSSWIKEKPTITDSLEHLFTFRRHGGKTCFIGDADSLISKPDLLTAILNKIQETFDSIQRFTIYGRTKTAAHTRQTSDLKQLCDAGLNRIHFGLESGSDKVLKLIAKGETKADHVKGLTKTKEAGLSTSVYVMPGLGGIPLSDEHALQTADVINQTEPDFVRLRTLQIFAQTPLYHQKWNNDFIEADEVQIIREIRQLIEAIDIPTQIVSDSAANLLAINGNLPEDKDQMLWQIDHFLNLSRRDKLLFSLESRMSSFMNQYGSLSKDIVFALTPYIKDGAIDYGAMPDAFIVDLICMIRQKLMP